MQTSGILVSDFDGTMTELDFCEVVRRRWWPSEREDPAHDYYAGRCTNFELLNRYFARIDCDEAELRRLSAVMVLDPALGDSVSRLQARGWEIAIASAGCRWYIDHLLELAGVKITVHANPGRFLPGRGLEMELPLASPFLSKRTGIDKSGVVREALTRSSCVVYAGDAMTDHAAILLVPAERRFARGQLAARLDQDGEGFNAFGSWSDIADQLLALGR